ncbi:hypothetical protein ACHAWF_008722 [Thalassiosira exigua]
MAADPRAVLLLVQAQKGLFGWSNLRSRLIPPILCFIAVASSIPSISISAFQCNPIARRLHLQFSMNQGAHSPEQEGTMPANKRMRPLPATDVDPKVGAERPKGTLYITVGPPCAGKTTILKRIFGKSFHKNEESVPEPLAGGEASAAGVDVTIDDQALVYIPVPTKYFLLDSNTEGSNRLESEGPEYNSNKDLSQPPFDEPLFGKTIRERITDRSNEELVLVSRRLGGILSAEEFSTRLQGGQCSAKDDLSYAIEHVIGLQEKSLKAEENADHQGATLPATVDLFIVESIFRPRPFDALQKMSNGKNPRSNTSALDDALHLMKSYATNPRVHDPLAPLSWGNTNTRPREFQSALESAALSGRPVEFIVYGGMEACEMIREHVSRREYRQSHGEESGSASNFSSKIIDEDESPEMQKFLCLPKVDRKTLLVRNLQRFLKTGRYIPSSAISDAVVRVDSLLATAAAEPNKDCFMGGGQEKDSQLSVSTAKFRLDYELAKLAGYRMKDDRTVSLLRPTFDARNGNGRDRGGGYVRGRYPGRADNRHQQSRRYHEERGRGHNGRGGSSSFHRGPTSNHRSYNNQGRGYDHRQWQESRGWPSHGYRPRGENRGSGYGEERSDHSNENSRHLGDLGMHPQGRHNG